MTPRSVFIDESVLFPEYVPRTTPHRTEQIRTLEHYFQSVVEKSSQASQNVLLYGPIGGGKTMLAKKLGEALQKKALLYGNLVKLLHVNCRIDRTLQSIFVKALNFISSSYPSRGYSLEELLHLLLERLKEGRTHLVIAFDEVDSLVSSDPSSLYTITRLREVSQGYQAFSSLLISKTLDYLKMVDLSTLSSVQWNTVSVDPYSAEELYDILVSRTGDAFRAGCLNEESIQLAASTASAYGDARYALDLIYRAGKITDLSGSSRVLPEYIRQAKASLPPQFRKEELSYLSKHQRVILMAISNLLKKSDVAYITIGDVEKSYNALCESMSTPPNHHTQLWNDVNELARKGFIETQLSGKGLRGRTTLISLSLIPAKELIGELEKGMVADVRN